jgi:hypothetical protein
MYMSYSNYISYPIDIYVCQMESYVCQMESFKYSIDVSIPFESDEATLLDFPPYVVATDTDTMTDGGCIGSGEEASEAAQEASEAAQEASEAAQEASEAAQEASEAAQEEEDMDKTIDIESYWSDDEDDEILVEILEVISSWAAEIDKEETERQRIEEEEEKAREVADEKAKLLATLDAEFDAVMAKYLAKKKKVIRTEPSV